MAKRRPNPRRVKLHRSYSIEEAAAVLKVHKNTVRNWLRDGLSAIDARRPILIHGEALADFLQRRRQKMKQRCRLGEMYCLRCRAPVMPAGSMADYLPQTATGGNLRGICPHCDTLVHRRVSLKRLDEARGILEISIQLAKARIEEGSQPSVNCDS